MLKKLLLLLTMLFLLSVGATFYAHQQLLSYAQSPLQHVEPLIIKVNRGQTAQQIRRLIPAEQTPLSDIYFKIWLRLNPDIAQVKTGYYEFPVGVSIADIFSRISRAEETQFSVSLVEGLTMREWYAQVSQLDSLEQDLPPLDELYASVVNSESSFCQNSSESLEGCLLADTYFYVFNDSALSLFKRAYQAMDKTLDTLWSQRFLDIPIKTPYESLILASIIEKETAVASERGVIAGVFSNRLELNMRLQTDPTVIYGIGPDFDGNITRAHLRERTAYNTYRINGLPPTPIAMAGNASLLAALQPAITEYIYFVAKGDGSHQFSVTLAEHNQAVATYQLNR
jgi:UPF0755 protein